MAFFSGNGGSITAPGGILNVGKWTLRKSARLAENTHSGTTATNYETVVPDNSGTVEIPWDSINIPDTGAGLAPGAKINITFSLGRSGKTETLTSTTVEFAEDVNDNAQDIVRTQVSFKGGVLTPAV